jgi:radical SAM protein with 4Fe4S-binding SPASM domain
LIAYAESKGQITGINTNGRRLKDKAYLQQLADAGLDHVQITLESHDAGIHDRMVCQPGAWQETVAGIRNVLEIPGLYMMTNTTMLNDNVESLGQTLDFLAMLGVPTLGLNALIYSGKGKQVGSGLREDALPPLLRLAQEKTEASQQKLIWYTPTQYCNFDPQSLELGVKGCTAAFYNMCTEPNGDVIPCQAYYDCVLGNLLKDDWQSIWEHPTAISLRERRVLPAACNECQFLQECGGGCPLARQSGRMADPNDPYDPLQGEGRNGGF